MPLAAIWLSLHRLILVFGERRWLGLENYGFMLGDARFWNALWNTVYFTGVAVTVGSPAALTPIQVRLLKRFASKVVLSFDPDAAGHEQEWLEAGRHRRE